MLAYYKAQIDQAIAEIQFPKQPADLYEPIRYILQLGGKRIRPLLVLLAADLFEENKHQKALPAALAVELFHNFTLMHDDIMDEAPLRRGQPTVHRKWDQNVAILAGDNLLVWAYKQLALCEPEKQVQLLPVFNEMASDVCEGQQWDMDYESASMISRADYIEMIRLKTAVLLGAALKMGALIGDASQEDASCLYDFGINIGIAFQLQDDILDTYGETEQFGKQIGGDILANKKTILLVDAYHEAGQELRNELATWLAVESTTNEEQNAQKIAAVKAVFGQLGMLERASELKEFYVNQAFSCLEKMSIPQDKLKNLTILAQSLLTRSH